MNLETELVLSFYQEVTALDEEKNVYLVKQVETGCLYVRKVLSIYDGRVYELLEKNNLAGIPRIIERVEDDGKLYLVEDYVHGRTLQQIFDERGPLPADEVKELMCQLCGILMGLHELEPAVVHRDIKPSNLVLTPDGMLKLIDFNSAKCVDGSEDRNRKIPEGTKTRDTRLLGTFNFAAPEQYGFGVSDTRTDQYGLAATMNYLLTGKYPTEYVYQGELTPVLQKCLMVDPSDRYGEIEQVLTAVEHLDRSWRQFLPVGFRSGKIWKMVVALLGYAGIVYLFLEPGEKEGYAYGIPVILAFLFTVGLLFDYASVRSRMAELFRSEALSWVISVVLILLGWMFAILFMMLC